MFDFVSYWLNLVTLDEDKKDVDGFTLLNRSQATVL